MNSEIQLDVGCSIKDLIANSEEIPVKTILEIFFRGAPFQD
ncbi:MAG: hypothetical protein ABGW97_17725 [Christiangramia sp.]